MFTEIKNESPVIYMKGVEYHVLKEVIKFVYLGECKVSEEDLEKFLLIGKEFTMVLSLILGLCSVLFFLIRFGLVLGDVTVHHVTLNLSRSFG